MLSLEYPGGEIFLSYSYFMNHDNIITWKCYPHYWPFVREIPLQRTSNAELCYFFVISLKKLLNKYLSYLRHLGFAWHHSNVLKHFFVLTSARHVIRIDGSPLSTEWKNQCLNWHFSPGSTVTNSIELQDLTFSTQQKSLEEICLFWLIMAWWHHMVAEVIAYCFGNKPWPEPMMTYHQRCSVHSLESNFTRNAQELNLKHMFGDYTFEIITTFHRDQWVK